MGLAHIMNIFNPPSPTILMMGTTKETKG